MNGWNIQDTFEWFPEIGLGLVCVIISSFQSRSSPHPQIAMLDESRSRQQHEHFNTSSFLMFLTLATWILFCPLIPHLHSE
jgi:hypothetical protein